MKITEDLVCFCYTFLSSIALFYNLGHHSLVTVKCENSKTFCLGHRSGESSFRYTFTAKDLEFRCNTEVVSVWIRVFLLLSVLYQLVAYGGAVYVYHYKAKTNEVDLAVIFRRCVYTIAGITGLFISIFLLLPFTSYILPSGGAGRWEMIAEVWASPVRGMALLILNIITEPLRWIFYNKFKTELGLEKLHANFSCIEPNMEYALLRCPKEFPTAPNTPDLSYCENEFYCTRDCLVAFPRVVINSLAFIFASLALLYRLLKLTRSITRRESDLIVTDVGSRVDIAKDCQSGDSQDKISSVLDELSGGDMKQKSVARSTKTGGLKKGESDVYPRRNAVRKRDEISENTQDPKDTSQSFDGAKARQKTSTDKLTKTKKVSSKHSIASNPDCSTEPKTKNLQLFELEANSDRRKTITTRGSFNRLELEEAKLETSSEQSTFLNGKSEHKEQNTLSNTITASKNGSFKHLPRTKQHRVAEDEFIARRNSPGLTNGDSISEHKTHGKTKKFHGKPTRTSMTNGHLRKEAKIPRRTTNVEVKMGSTGDTEESEELSSDDIVDGIEGLLVEDESEFYMSGFRL